MRTVGQASLCHWARSIGLVCGGHSAVCGRKVPVAFCRERPTRQGPWQVMLGLAWKHLAVRVQAAAYAIQPPGAALRPHRTRMPPAREIRWRHGTYPGLARREHVTLGRDGYARVRSAKGTVCRLSELRRWQRLGERPFALQLRDRVGENMARARSWQELVEALKGKGLRLEAP